MKANYHEPVLRDEVSELLITDPEGTYVDCTLGGGGHFRTIAGHLHNQAVLVGIDRDPDAVAWNRENAVNGPKVIIEQSRFSQFDNVLRKNKIGLIDGVLLDLGVSSHQIDKKERGFSYMQEESRLDMRMNPLEGLPAEELLRRIDEERLAEILSEYGEIQNSVRMAKTIKNRMNVSPIRTSADLKDCLRKEYGPNLNVKIIAKAFQALRIEVNDELGELTRFLDKVIKYLKTGGRLAVISYHSLEDRIVKEFIRLQEQSCICPLDSPICTCSKPVLLKRVTKKAIKSSEKETAENPRSRSARLRVAEKTEEGNHEKR
jgi:16S rRNA (cytosine1402-N4)-methyltransferase